MTLVVTSLIVLLLAACSGGNLPTQGTLPSLDGSQLRNVSVDHVGDATAAQISAGVATLGAATETAAASTMVKRDANGGFSAGTITAALNGNATTATFSMGKQGANLSSATPLALGDDGNYFSVKGTTDIAAFSARPAGQKVQLLFSEDSVGSAKQLKLIHGANLKLSGGGYLYVYAGDYFEFVSEGGGVWREVLRNVMHDSRIYYIARNPSETIGNPPVVVHYDQKWTDYQSEYDPVTGIFTAHQSGEYQVSVGLQTANANYSAGDRCVVTAFTPSFTNTVASDPGNVASITASTIVPNFPSNGSCFATASGTLRVEAGQNIVMAGGSFRFDGTARNTTLIYNPSIGYVTIVRLRN